MFNPFSPIYGAVPNVIFGREQILYRFDTAMHTQGSLDRAIYVTGMRGVGKTTVLETLSERASSKGRYVFDLGPYDTVNQLLSDLVGYANVTVVVGTKANYGREHLQSLLFKACERAEHGVLATIDDVQSIDLDDVSAIVNAVQMASRKGYDIMLAVASLPSGYERVIHHDGCTFLRRATLEELGLLTYAEAHLAFVEAFDTVSDLNVSADALKWLNRTSYGHPYLMQLLGFFAIEDLKLRGVEAGYTLVIDDLEAIEPIAMAEYDCRVLKPMVGELSPLEVEYLKAMSICLDDERLVSLGQVAGLIKQPLAKINEAYDRLIGDGIIASPEPGKVMFCVPHLSTYIMGDLVGCQ